MYGRDFALRRALTGLLVLCASATLGVTGATAAPSVPAALCSGTVVPSANSGSGSNLLTSVSAPAVGRPWAVGYRRSSTGALKTLTERWDGIRWRHVASPNSGPEDNLLLGVSALSDTDAWAVGRYASASAPLAEHWNGTRWKIVLPPNAGNGPNVLASVAAVSPTEVWAVGNRTTVSGVSRTLAERWNGTRWRIVPTPNAGSGPNFLSGVAADSSGLWAVGEARTGGVYRTLIERWNGSSWNIVASPNQGAGDNFLSGVASLSSTNAWAVGQFVDHFHVVHTLTLHLVGATWVVVPSPNVGAGLNALFGVAIRSSSDALAVGDYVSEAGPTRTLAEQWDGTQWNIIPSPNRGNGNNYLVAASADDAGYWAVGNHAGVNPTARTLAERFC